MSATTHHQHLARRCRALVTGVAAFALAGLGGGHAVLAQTALLDCLHSVPPREMTEFDAAPFVLPDRPDVTLWGAELVTHRDRRLFPLAADTGSSVEIRMPPVEWSTAPLEARFTLRGFDASGRVLIECPERPIRVLPAPSPAGAFHALMRDALRQIDATDQIGAAFGGQALLPEEMTADMRTQIETARVLYDVLDAPMRRLLDAEADWRRRTGASVDGMFAALEEIGNRMGRPVTLQKTGGPFGEDDLGWQAGNALFRPEDHWARLWHGQVGGLPDTPCPADADDLIWMSQIYADARITNAAGPYQPIKRATETAISTLTGAIVAKYNAKAGEIVGTSLSSAFATNVMIAEFVLGTYAVEPVRMSGKFTDARRFEDSPPGARNVSLSEVHLTTTAPGWDASKAAIDAVLNVYAMGKTAKHADPWLNFDFGDKLPRLTYGAFKDAAQGIVEGEKLGQAYNWLQKGHNDRAIRVPKKTCKVDIFFSNLWRGEATAIPGGNALRQRSADEKQVFVAAKAGRGAVTLRLDTSELAHPASGASGLVEMTIPRIGLTLDGPVNVPFGGSIQIEARLTDHFLPRRTDVVWDAVLPQGAQFSITGPDQITVFAPDNCKASQGTILATLSGDFLEESDAETRPVTKALTFQASQRDSCKDEDDEDEPQEQRDFSVGMRCDYEHQADQPIAVIWCESPEEAELLFGPDGEWIRVELHETWGRFIRTEKRLSDIANEILLLEDVHRGYPGAPMALMGPPGEAAAFAAADPVIYELAEQGGPWVPQKIGVRVMGLGPVMYTLGPPLLVEGITQQVFTRLPLSATPPPFTR